MLHFVTDSYKRMPPVGLEIFGPMLRTLAEDTLEIKELLPKMVDIKSEVCNATDTLRDMKMDLRDIKNKFNKAVEGMEEAAKDITMNEAQTLDELESLRMNTQNGSSPSQRRINTGRNKSKGGSYAENGSGRDGAETTRQWEHHKPADDG